MKHIGYFDIWYRLHVTEKVCGDTCMCVHACVCIYEYESHLHVQHTHKYIDTHTIDLPISKMARYANEAKATVERTTATHHVQTNQYYYHR